MTKVVNLKYAVQVRATKRWWTERGIYVAELSDPDIKLYRDKKVAAAAARIVGERNARTNELYHSAMPEAHDVVTIRQTLEVVE
ncbi:MAG: hypothetical protein EOQ93_29325 [Mesorhizobium sp.]|nr:MAG: hypothetical protein EOQ93_29325 [Mesorhizobium sp.]